MKPKLVGIHNYGCVIEGLKVRFVYDLDMSVSLTTMASLARALKEDVEVLNETQPELALKMEELALERWETCPGQDIYEVLTWVLSELQHQLDLPTIWTITHQNAVDQVTVRTFSDEEAAHEEAVGYLLAQLSVHPESLPLQLQQAGVPLAAFHRHLVSGEFKQAYRLLLNHLGSISEVAGHPVQLTVQQGVLRNEARPSVGLGLLMESLLQA